MRSTHLTGLCLLALVFSTGFTAPVKASGESGKTNLWSFGGHTKYQYIHTHIPEDSVLQDISGDSLQDHNLEVRLKATARRNHWDFNTHLQFITVHSDTLSGFRDLPLPVFPGAGIINEDRRWFELADEIGRRVKMPRCCDLTG